MALTPFIQPFEQFGRWFSEAKAHASIEDASAMCLSTSEGSQPDSRMVLLKDWDEHGFTFYTNLNSTKSRQLRGNPHAALCFFWQPLYKQVRIRGAVEPVSEAEADAYFATRPRGSQLSAWASHQSEPVKNRADLEAAMAEIEARFTNQDVPRPPHWSGWRIIPLHIEFWTGQVHRLHIRESYTLHSDGWDVTLLQP